MASTITTLPCPGTKKEDPAGVGQILSRTW